MRSLVVVLAVVLVAGGACSDDNDRARLATEPTSSADGRTSGGDERTAVSSGCRSSESTAHEAALGGAQLQEIVTADTFEATLDAIEDAQGEPFQHRPDDMDAVMCVFVLRGTRPDPSRDAVTVVVLDPESPPDPPGAGEGFFFTETNDGDDAPSWVGRLESAHT